MKKIALMYLYMSPIGLFFIFSGVVTIRGRRFTSSGFPLRGDDAVLLGWFLVALGAFATLICLVAYVLALLKKS